jgi:predicted phage baseplate assembly protein
VLVGESIQVREWTGRGDDWQTAVLGVAPADLQFDIDPTDGKTVVGVWVTWHNVPYFYTLGPDDRGYTLERATGLLAFPAPPYGMIPPAGATIRATYATGGGLNGNVPAGTISELHSGASYVQSVTNPFAATGGSATEDTTRARDRATQRIRNRQRALAPADFEWIAREASPQVARARCLPTNGPDGTRELGWVTLVVVPNSTDAAPSPTDGLLAEVRTALNAVVPVTIVGSIELAPPSYTAISVRADIVPNVADEAALVEARVRDRLTTFLHPLLGGPNGTGWDFGQGVYLSQVATLLEATEGVNYVSLLQLLLNDGVVGDVASVGPDTLIAQGEHQLKLLVSEG